jgi:hypothetical protein
MMIFFCDALAGTCVSARRERTSSSPIGALRAFAVHALIVALFTFAPPATGPAIAQVLPPVTSVMTVPWSGTLVTDLEEISVSGVMRIQVESRFTRRNVFTKIRTSISQTVGVGVTSGQTLVGVGVSLNTCSIPTNSRSAGRFPLEFISQHELVPTDPIFPMYQRVRRGPLPLIYEITLGGDGRLAGAVVRIGATRFRPASIP